MQDLSIDQVRNSLKLLDIKRKDSEINSILDKINSDPEFDSRSRVLYYFHRELEQILNPCLKRQGFAQSVLMKVQNSEGVLCIDTSETKLNHDDIVEMRLCRPEENLTSINLTIPDLV